MSTSTVAASRSTRIFYIDNLRILLTGLVVLHHLAITYGGPGSWYYQESEAGFPEVLLYGMFLATNQAFFMGMFFFISAYFMVPSLHRKGTETFTKDRLIRLGIPILFFFFVLSPCTVFLRNRYIYNEPVTFLSYLVNPDTWGSGPMWFVEALVIFTFAYVLMRAARQERIDPRSSPLPGTIKILLLAGLVGMGQFVIRIWLPVGWAMPVTGFQFPHFLQYITLFALGIVAYERNWLKSISRKQGWRWFLAMQMLIFIGFPVLFVLGDAPNGGIDPFMGGLTWHSFAYAIWEQIVGFGMIVALLGIFKTHLNRQGAFAKKLSASAYAVYVFHPPLLMLISILFLQVDIPQLLKFLILAPITLIVCFLVGYLVKSAPVARDILSRSI